VSPVNVNPVLNDYPNPDHNVFLMTRFRDTKQHIRISETITKVLSSYSLNLIRADEKQYHNELWTNTKLCMDASRYGIAIIEQIDERDFNPNVNLELGYMLGQNKKCLILKEKRVNYLFTDLLGHLFREFDAYEIEESVSKQVTEWLKDLGIAKKSDEKMLVYVSMGGTCRCAMAKAITRKLLADEKARRLCTDQIWPFDLRIESRARGSPSLSEASVNARKAMIQLFNEDLLVDHSPAMGTDKKWEEADLILLMDRTLGKGLPEGKTFIFKEFFGLKGDIEDPWPSEENAASRRRYLKCAREMKTILENNTDRIFDFLSKSQT